MEPLIFDKENLRHTVEINKEEPFFKVVDTNVSKGDANSLKLGFFHYNLISTNALGSGYLPVDQTSGKKGTTFQIGGQLNANDLMNFDRIEFYFERNEINDCELEVYYTTENLDISIEAPFLEFREHFEESNNTRILFSAPFGQGKTTFMKEFFKKEFKGRKKYEVFHLFPVNYAVATNEDIFRLIKTEILVKLLKNDSIEFRKEEFKYLDTLPQFALKNAHKILSPFLKAIPYVGESAFGIYEKLEELTKAYFVEHDKLQIDDGLTAGQYIQKAYDDEGSIFEDNFYSKLIRQLIQQLKDLGKETVLIIDDTDRMDPEHIFRILNVFAAHFDAPEYKDGDSNKFGFDKIIVVCDYDNLHRIFCHRFGPSTDFAGYIDKFFSNHIFRYNNAEAIKKYINEFAVEQMKKDRLSFLLNDLIDTNSISLRELFKQKRSLNQIQKQPDRFVSKGLTVLNTVATGFIPSMRLLLLIFNKETLIEKLKHCKIELSSRVIVNGNRHKDECLYAGADLAILSCKNYQDKMRVKGEFENGRQYDFHLKYVSRYPQNDCYILEKITKKETEEEIVGSVELFYDLLIEIVRKL